MHATVMIFLFIIPMLAGFGNYAVPLQIGAPDMAFPRINALSFWMLPLGGILLLSGFLTDGGAAAAGWTSYPPLSSDRPQAATGPGQDLWIVSLILIGTSSILGAINFLVTIFKMRAPGMTLFRMPILVWTVLVTSVLVVMATPVITSALVMLFIDRNLGGHFFDPATGGNAILYQNVFWFYSHPAVYVMVLPAMGIISEILPVFSRKPLFGYRAFIFATAGIGGLGFSVWAHHMFTTGQVYLPFFSLMTFLIAVPTGVKMFNWIATMIRGQLTLSTPLLFALGFLSMFLIGGINGAFSASVPVDFALHDTYWVVAHLHYVLFGGSVFGVMAGLYYWFPKMTGRMLDEGLGKVQFVLMFIGFNMTFFPMHMLGMSGMPRRIADYANSSWNDLNLLATVGGLLIGVSMLPLLWNIFVSLRNGKVAGDDPWEANTLEWATSSPPPPYNFDRLPEIRSERPLFDLRHGRTAH
jgi:cytochrome c oxidase subunit 1